MLKIYKGLEKQVMIGSKEKSVLKKIIIQNEIILKHNLQMSSLENWEWLIQKHMFINSFTMKTTVMSQR